MGSDGRNNWRIEQVNLRGLDSSESLKRSLKQEYSEKLMMYLDNLQIYLKHTEMLKML